MFQSVSMSVHNYHMIIRSLLHVCDRSMYWLPLNLKLQPMSYKVHKVKSESNKSFPQSINSHVRFYQLPWHSTLPLQALRDRFTQNSYCIVIFLVWLTSECVMTTVANYKMSIRRNATILNKVSNTDKFWRKLYTVPITTLELQHGKLDTFCDPVVAKIKDKIMNFPPI